MKLAEQARQYHDNLLADPTALSKLRDLRGWTAEAIAQLGIGIDGNRITIPIC